MTEREQAVVELLRLRFDWIPGPRTWTGSLVDRNAKRGEISDAAWFDCPRCGGRKTLGKGKGEKPCERCAGQGRVQGDPYIIDRPKSKEALEFERATGVDETVGLRRRRGDQELRKLELQAKHRKGLIDPGEKEKWEADRASLYRQFSLAELDMALDALGQQSLYDRQALEIVYSYEVPLQVVGEALQRRADAALAFVAVRMPERISWPSGRTAAGTGRWANGQAQQQRDREIWRLHLQDGLNAAQIGRRLGVDRSTVGRILKPSKEGMAA